MLRRLAFAVAASASLALIVTDASGTVQRTFVASYGLATNTAFNCSIVKPCRAFSDAIGVTSAGGEVIVLDSAGYGPVSIAKSVSLIAPPGVYAGITVFTGDGVTVNAAGATVLLRGLSINGQGGAIGVDVIQVGRLRLERCVISNMALYGVAVFASGSESAIVDTIIRDNGDAGVNVNTDASALLDNVRVVHNAGAGVNVLAAASVALATIRNSVISQSGQAGIAALRPSAPALSQVTVESSVIADNSGDGMFVGGIAGGRSHGTLTRNTIARNGLSGISVFDGFGGGLQVDVSAFENQFVDNGSSAIKVDGPAARSFVSKNNFASAVRNLATEFDTENGAFQHSFGDNTGWSTAIGSTLAEYPPF